MTEYRARILVVDDLADNRDLLTLRLERQGYEVCTAANGVEALNVVSTSPVDLILLDILMPELDGYGVLHQLKSNPDLKHIPVIMISALTDVSGIIRCIEDGADDYLTKPFNPVLLNARIAASLERKRLHDQEAQIKTELERSLREAGRQKEIARAAQLKLVGELTEAADYVRSLLPPPLKGDIKAEYQYFPSAHLGGDAFSFHWLDETHLAFYILDVCGHGIRAAMLSISITHVLRSQVLPNTDFSKPDEVLEALNDAFQMEKHNNMFFTIWYGVYHSASGILSYSCAGHPPALLFQVGDAIPLQLKARGCAVGLAAGTRYEALSFKLERPATMYLLSDGVYEITGADGTMMKFEDFMKLVPQFLSTGISDSERVLKLIMDHSGGSVLEDDFCLLQITFS